MQSDLEPNEISNFKKKTPRDSKYLAWIRTLPCLMCKTDLPAGESHHTETGGMGLVGSDYSAIPICVPHHREIHNTMSKRGPWKPEELELIKTKLMERYSEERSSHVP